MSLVQTPFQSDILFGSPDLTRNPIESLPSQWLSVDDIDYEYIIKQAILAHGQGIFAQTGLLADSLNCESKLATALKNRINAAVTLPFAIQSATTFGRYLAADTTSESAKRVGCGLGFMPTGSGKVAEQADKFATAYARWRDHRIDRGPLMDAIERMVLMGFALGSVSWKSARDARGDAQIIVDKIVWHHPCHMHFVWSPNGGFYQLSTTSHGTLAINDFDNGRFCMLAQHSQWPFRHGAIRCIAGKAFARNLTYLDMMKRAEIEAIGRPIVHFQDEGRSDDFKKIKKEFLEGRGGIGFLPEGWDYKITSTDGQAYQVFQALIEMNGADIVEALVGTTLTTQEGANGSYGRATQGRKVQQALIELDAGSLARWERKCIVMPWGRENFADWDDDLAPVPWYDPTSSEELQQRAAALQSFSQAIATLGDIAKPASLDKFASLFGIEIDHEKLAKRAQSRSLGPLDTGPSAPPGRPNEGKTDVD